MGSIYKHTCVHTGKSYIGYTKRDPQLRRKEHFWKNGNQPLKDDVEKYGKDAFKFEVLEYGIIPEFLPERERYWIAKFDTFHNGYNLTTGGGSSTKVSEETCQKISVSLKGKPKPEGFGDKVSASLKGRKHPEQAKRKMSESKKGKNYGVIGENHPKFGKPSYNRRPEFTQAHEMYLSLPPEMSIVEKRKYLQKNMSGVPKDQISRWIQRWAGTSGRNPTHPDYERAHKFFLSLPSDMNMRKKRCLIRDSFPKISEPTLYRWLKMWTGITMPVGDHTHPDKESAYKHFLTLPPSLPTTRRVRIVLDKFPNLNKETLRKWSYEWVRKTNPNSNYDGKTLPEKSSAYKLFLSLPSDMPLSEKRRLLREQFPNVKRPTLNKWIRQWKPSELTPKGEQK